MSYHLINLEYYELCIDLFFDKCYDDFLFAILELVRTGDEEEEEERRAGEEDEVAREPSFRLCAGELLSSAVVSAAADAGAAAGAAVKLKRKVEKN